MASDASDLDRLLDLAEYHANQVLVSFGLPELEPLFHLRCPGGDCLVPTPFADEASKDIAAELIRGLIRERQATAYMFVSEAWMITRQAGYDGSVRPAEADDRIEVVIAIATDGADYRMRRWRIKRRKGKCVKLVLDSTDDDDVPVRTGRFDNLFTHH